MRGEHDGGGEDVQAPRARAHPARATSHSVTIHFSLAQITLASSNIIINIIKLKSLFV